MRSKKLDDEFIRLEDGTAYKVAVRVEQEHSGGPLSLFTITFPWGNKVEAHTMDELLKKAKEEAENNGKLKREKVLCVSSSSWGINESKKEQTASLGIEWRVGFRSQMPDGRFVFWDENGKRSYSYDHFNAIIPWTSATEQAMRTATDSLRKIQEFVDEAVNSENLAKTLEGGNLLRLTAGKKHHENHTP